jgi:hypothetical protein
LSAVSSTALTASGDVNFGGILNVTGKATLGNASTTNLSVSGNSYLGSLLFTNATGTTLSLTGNITAANISGSNTGDVTLAGENYLSRSGQQITANAINLNSSNVTGVLQTTNGGIGTSTLGSLTVGSGLSITGGQSVLIGTSTQVSLGSSVVTSVVNDTNVTGSISSNALTLGWTGALGVSRGGTGTSTTPSNDTVLVGNGTGYNFASLPACDSAAEKLIYSTSTNSFTCAGDAGAGGGITSLNLQIGSSQTFATSTSGGIDLYISSASNVHTFTAAPSSGYSIPLTASSTNWNNFYNSPASYLVAGSNINLSSTSTIAVSATPSFTTLTVSATSSLANVSSTALTVSGATNLNTLNASGAATVGSLTTTGAVSAGTLSVSAQPFFLCSQSGL